MRETISATLTASAVALGMSAVIVGAVTPWHGVVLLAVTIVFAAVALMVSEP